MKTKKTTAFYIEALVLTLFLLISSVVLLKMFAAARDISLKAKHGSDAVIIAQNACEQFTALLDRGLAPFDAIESLGGENGEDGYKINYSADGLPFKSGEYSVFIRTYGEASLSGKSHKIFISVYNASNEAEPIFELETSKFVNTADS